MLRLFLIVGLAATSDSTDEIFKTCEEILFCYKFRNNCPDQNSLFSANISSSSIKDNTLIVPLKNKEKTDLVLKISLLENRKARVKVEEVDSSRFELKNIVIENEPKTLDVEMKKAENYIILSPTNTNITYKAMLMKQGPSFNVEFYYKEELDVVLEGDRLFMKNDNSDSYAFNARFENTKKMYGLSSHADKLALRDTSGSDPFRFRNSDSWGYKAYTTEALYGTVPFIYGHSSNNTYGIFLHNAAEQWIDINYKYKDPTAYFMVESASFDLFVLFGPTTKDVVRQLVDLTGKAHMPQLWTLGYHQCRFSYMSEDDVREVVTKMDENDFPMDAIWLDGDHANHSKWFQFNEITFKHPLELMKYISSTGRWCVSISDPHIKVDDTYPVYAGAKEKYFMKAANGGNDYQANCWPGLSSWIDFLNPKAADYYASWYAFDKFNGSTPTLAGIWNDMNEPAVFNDNLEKTVPFDAVHYENVKHRDIHNIYGFLQTKATHKGLFNRDQGKKRPFILTRSHFAGSQRYAAMWTGDSTATWDHLAVSYPQCMTSNLGGMVFCGTDIGGFIGNTSDELLQRWYQAAVWTPFFRGHSSKKSKRREPYLFDKNVRDVIRNAIRLRYRHIPVFYNLFYQYTRTGDPIIRPLFYEYPHIFERDNQLLLGTDIMAVAIIKSEVTNIEVEFPGNSENDCWYRIDGNSWKLYNPGVVTIDVDIHTSPVFYRCGSIIVTKDIVKRSTNDTLHDPYNVYVNLDKNNNASGTFYIDDFVSFDYLENKYLHIGLSYNGNGGLNMRIIDGINNGFKPTLNKIIIHNAISSGNEINSISIPSVTSHTNTRNGTPLVDLDISRHLSMKGDTLLLYL